MTMTRKTMPMTMTRKKWDEMTRKIIDDEDKKSNNDGDDDNRRLLIPMVLMTTARMIEVTIPSL